MRLLVVLFAVLFAVAGCGGGGGGSSSSPGVSISTPVIVQTPASLSGNTSLQRTLVQQGLTSTSEAGTIAQYAAPSSTLSAARRAFAARRSVATVSACSNSTIDTTTPVSANVEDLTIDTYYDTACTQLWWVGQFVLTAASSTSGTLAGSYTYYTQSGTVYEYVGGVTIALGGLGTGSGYFSVGANIAASQTAQPYANLGVGCSIASTSSSCSVAAVAHLAAISLDEGTSATMSATLTGNASSTVVGLSGSGAGYTAALNALNIAPQGVSGWAITGGSPAVTLSLTGSVTFATTGALAAETLALTDSADGATVSMSYNGIAQLITGTVVQTSTGGTVATFSVSATGTGTVTYGTGTVAQIVNWVVQS
jgi:hypothetical protein